MIFLLQSGWFEGWTWQGHGAGLLAFIVGLSALISAIKTIRNDGWEAFKQRWITPWKTRRKGRENMLTEFGEMRKSCDTMGQQIGEILREVKPNGGTSLKDRVIGIDDKVENIIAERRHQNERSDVAIFKLDGVGEMIYTNCAFRELVNAEEDQLEHHNFLSLMDDDDRRRFVRSREEAIQFKMPIDVIAKFKLTGPHFVTVRLQASPDVRHGGELKGFFGTASKVDGGDAIHV